MRQGDAFPSKYLASADLILNGQPKRIAVTFESVEIQQIRSQDGTMESKPVAHFRGKDKSMVLNKTNWARTADLLGSDDSDDWIGKAVVISVEKTDMGGKRVNALRVIGKPKPGTVPAPPPPPEPLEDEIEPDGTDFAADDSDVPF